MSKHREITKADVGKKLLLQAWNYLTPSSSDPIERTISEVDGTDRFASIFRTVEDGTSARQCCNWKVVIE